MRITIVISSLVAILAIASTALFYEDRPKEVFVVTTTPFEYPAETVEPEIELISTSTPATTTNTSHSIEIATTNIRKPVASHTDLVPPLTKTVAVETKPPTMTTIKNKTPIVPVVTKKSSLKWGVFTGSNPTAIKEFENKIKVNPDYLAYFIHWGNGEGALPKFLTEYARDKNRTLVLFWEASDYKIGGTVQPAFSYKAILRGDWDKYLKDFAKQTLDYKGSIILIPFSELNGNWTPWSGTTNGNTPEEAVRAFRYVHKFFKGVDNVKFGLAVNAASVPNTPANSISAYYPGDDYVDYVGVDGFNVNSPWHSFDEIFRPALLELSKFNKPMFIFSFASAEGNKKAAWLDDALNIQMPKYPLLKGFIYFNQNKEHNWLLWSDADTLKIFNDYVKD